MVSNFTIPLKQDEIHFDFKAARLLANDMLVAHLNYQLSKPKYQEENNYFQEDQELPEMKWSDKKTAFAEIFTVFAEKKV